MPYYLFLLKMQYICSLRKLPDQEICWNILPFFSSADIHIISFICYTYYMKTKLCPKCGETKPISEFHKDKSRKSGVYSYCKKCNYISSRSYIKKKPDYYKEYQQKYHQAHLEKHREYMRKYSKERYRNNRELYRNYVRQYRARKRNSVFPSFDKINKRIIECGNNCIYCLGDFESIDHVIPLSKGGTNNINNLVPSCLLCNKSKYNRDWQTWYKSQPFYDKQQELFILNSTLLSLEI